MTDTARRLVTRAVRDGPGLRRRRRLGGCNDATPDPGMPVPVAKFAGGGSESAPSLGWAGPPAGLSCQWPGGWTKCGHESHRRPWLTIIPYNIL